MYVEQQFISLIRLANILYNIHDILLLNIFELKNNYQKFVSVILFKMCIICMYYIQIRANKPLVLEL